MDKANGFETIKFTSKLIEKRESHAPLYVISLETKRDGEKRHFYAFVTEEVLARYENDDKFTAEIQGALIDFAERTLNEPKIHNDSQGDEQDQRTADNSSD